jgi:hypothetical protein
LTHWPPELDPSLAYNKHSPHTLFSLCSTLTVPSPPISISARVERLLQAPAHRVSHSRYIWVVHPHPTLYPNPTLVGPISQNGPSMAHSRKRTRPQVDYSLPDQKPIKRPRLSGVSRNHLQTLNPKYQADNTPHDQVLSQVKPGVTPPKSPRSQNRKRRAEDSLPSQIPPKKSKSADTVDAPWNFSPEFYSSLSKIWLTPRALRELDRQNNISSPKPKRRAKLIALAKLGVEPDLFDLLGVCRHDSIMKKSY